MARASEKGGAIEERALDELGERFSGLRIPRPRAEAAIEKSLQTYGQLSPVICARIGGADGLEVVDGFKRVRASRRLAKRFLLARTLDLTVRACKATLIELNHISASLHAMEEALVIHSLYREDGLRQEEIGALVGHDKSWVSRRLRLVEALDPDVQRDIRLGLLTVVAAREVARLPRGNQQAVTASILKHRLSTRDVSRLVAHLLTRPRWEYDRILANPWELFEERPPKSSDLVGALIGMKTVCRRVVERVGQASPDELEPHWDLMEEACAFAQRAIHQIQLAGRRRGPV
ncbi:MAG: ParB/RepB/Spo0J family partition protein [Longimicrobiales bacterium]